MRTEETKKKTVKPELIVALDVKDLTTTHDIVRQLSDNVKWYKVGLELFAACGPVIISTLKDNGKNVFLDLKLHDIPNTVAGVVKSAVVHGVSMITVHASGGGDMLQAAVEASANNVKIIAVTVLTSLSETDLNVQGIARPVHEQVITLAELAMRNGVHGFVCSPKEASCIRNTFGDSPLIITPGIRLDSSIKDDQKRIGSPEFAVLSGANFLVVGRPILRATNPVQAANEVIQRIESAWIKKQANSTSSSK